MSDTTQAAKLVNVEFYGSASRGWSGSTEPTTLPELKPCAFCGATAIVLVNTHTPSYWVECEECEAHGPNGSPSSYRGGRIPTRKLAEQLHREAIADAIEKWNERHAD